MMRTLAFLIALLLLSCSLSTPLARADDKLIVHEWGTFTSLQTPDGRTLGAINTDDEPVPAFVHHPEMVLSPYAKAPAGPTLVGGAPRNHPDVTMRMETPVIYFHLPKNTRTLKLDVNVQFRGGLITEYFPDALVATDLYNKTNGNLTDKTTGDISWKFLTVGTDAAGPKTDEKVWLAPRDVKADSVSSPRGNALDADGFNDRSEAEKFLFYRGVAHLEAPLRVTITPFDHSQKRVAATGTLISVFLQPDPTFKAEEPLRFPALWLVDVDAAGGILFYPIRPVITPQREPVGQKTGLPLTSLKIYDPPPKDYSKENLDKLRDEMKKALVKEGLFEDEAAAMLNTWEASYFKSPGLRLFYIVPRQWTDHYLPLKLSVDADITRVMVGRIELVQPRLLDKTLAAINAAGPPSRQWLDDALRDVAKTAPELYKQILSGRAPITQASAAIPADYKAYLDLGRFRDAILLDHAAKNPSPKLTAFLTTYGITPHQPAVAAPSP